MYCNRCGYNNQQGSCVCSNCGNELDVYRCTSPADIDERLLAEYIGKNAKKIQKQYGDSFSWPFLFFSYFYLFYRKQYVKGFILGVSYATIVMYEESIASETYPLFIIFHVVILIYAFKFNKYYIRTAKKKVEKIKRIANEQAASEISEKGLLNICASKGGTNPFMVFGGFVAVIAACMLVDIYILSEPKYVTINCRALDDEAEISQSAIYYTRGKYYSRLETLSTVHESDISHLSETEIKEAIEYKYYSYETDMSEEEKNDNIYYTVTSEGNVMTETFEYDVKNMSSKEKEVLDIINRYKSDLDRYYNMQQMQGSICTID